MQAYRTVGAVLTVLALTLSLAEAVWASTCAPMAMSPVAAAVEHAAQPQPDCPGQVHGQQNEDDPGSHCPFSPVVGHDCAAAASLPAHPTLASMASLELTMREPAAPQAIETLIGAAPFRPPRA